MKNLTLVKKAVISLTVGLALGLSALLLMAPEKPQYTITKIEAKTVKKVPVGEHVANIFMVDYVGGFSINSSEIFANKVDMILERARKNDYMVINISSGGGSVVSCSHDVEQVKRVESLGIKTISIIDYQAASCGYMLASETNTIVASSGAIVGNIGSVFKRQASTLEMMEKKSGVKSHYIGSSRIKEVLAGSPLNSESDVDILRGMAVRSFNEFKDVVVKGRGNRIDKSNYDEIFSGMYWSGLEAKELGLVDIISNYREMV